MTNFSVDSDALASSSRQVQATIDRLRTDVNSMQSGLVALADIWRGSASSNFQVLVTDWRTTQAKVEESLDSINRALAFASTQYAETEEANTALFRH